MTKNILAVILLSALFVGLTGGQPANAGFAKGDCVTMAGVSVFKMASADGFSSEHRAWLAQDALDNALVLASNRTPSAVTVGRENGAVIISLDGRRVATVDANSAQQAQLSVDALAQQWAKSVESFLANTERTAAYVASLKHDQHVDSFVAKVERTMYAPAGMSFQVKLTSALASASFKEGDTVEGTVSSDVPLGHYVIPAGALVTGRVVEGDQDNFGIRFQTIKGSDGRVFAIDGVITNQFPFASEGPHTVCTYAIPSGMANGVPLVAGRIPAGIGIGTRESNDSNFLVFHRNTADTLVAGKLLLLQMESTSPVAVLLREKMI